MKNTKIALCAATIAIACCSAHAANLAAIGTGAVAIADDYDTLVSAGNAHFANVSTTFLVKANYDQPTVVTTSQTVANNVAENTELASIEITPPAGYSICYTSAIKPAGVKIVGAGGSTSVVLTGADLAIKTCAAASEKLTLKAATSSDHGLDVGSHDVNVSYTVFSA